jgi:hypothetical protein
LKKELEKLLEKYIFYLRLFVEELKKYHPDFPNVSVNDRERVTKAFPRAEELKDKLKEKYAQEYEENHVCQINSIDHNKTFFFTENNT